MWYEFHQNNSGGVMITDDKVCETVFIEADSDEEADERAQELGIYFSGCASGIDCPCCGDRWNETYGPETFPIKWDDNKELDTIEEWAYFLAGYRSRFDSTEEIMKRKEKREPLVRVYYKDGEPLEIYN